MDQLGDSGDDGSWLDEIIFRESVENLAGAGEENTLSALFKRQDSDGSGRGDRHFAGAGLAARKGCYRGNKKKQQSVI